MLNDTQVKNLKIKEVRYYVPDAHGLRLQINPSGSKIWQHRYRYEGKATIMHLGAYPDTSLLDARQSRDKNKQLIKQGVNPKRHKSSSHSNNTDSITFSDMFKKWHANQVDQWSENYAIDVLQRADMYLLPFIGNTPIKDIDTPTMRMLLLDIQAKGVLDTLQKIKSIASRVFRYSVGMGVININPVRDLPSDIFKKKPEKHFATITDPKKIAWLLNILDNNHMGSDQVRAALIMLPHVFLRSSEMAGLLWSEVDFGDRLIRVDANRMKKRREHLVPMSHQVYEMLWDLSKIERGSDYVFPSPRNKNAPITGNSMLVALRTLGISKEDFVIHGFRHMASTRLHELGFMNDVIDLQMSHKQTNKVAAIYNQAEHLDKRKLMMQKWSDYLDEIKGYKTDSKETLTIDDTIEKLKANIDRLTM